MSRLIDIDDERFLDILFDEACVEGNQAERIENELDKISVDEKEIRNKAIDEFVERLKKHLDRRFSFGIENKFLLYNSIDKIAEEMRSDRVVDY